MKTKSDKVSPAGRGRPPKFDKILAALRADILSGEYQPGDRLPTREVLAKLFSSTKVTMQKAMDVLIEEGLLTARRGAGTYVTDSAESNLPIFLIVDHERGVSRFTDALITEAETRVSGKHIINICVFKGLNYTSPEIERLYSLIHDHRVAGILLALPWKKVRETPIFKSTGTPKVFIGMREYSEDTPHVTFQGQINVYARVLDHFKAQGCRSAALIRSIVNDSWLLDDPFPQMAKERGLNVPEEWLHGAPRSSPATAARVAKLLFRNHKDAPEALHIADDNFVPAISAILADSSISAAKDLKVTAHANFPYPTACHVPARRIGYDARQFVQKGLDALSRIREGLQPANSVIPAIWEDEVSPRIET